MNILTQYGQDIIGLDSELVNKITEADTFIHTNKAAASGGTDLTVVTTGEKYNWNNASGGGAGILYGTCSTTALTAAKEVTVNGTFTLADGVAIAVKFHFENTASNPTLNVNSTGAKSIQTNGGTTIYSGEYISLLKGTVIFVYNAGSWWIIGNYFNNKVTQTNSTANSNYRLLLGSINDNTETTSANKSANFTANPSTGNLTIGGQLTDKWGLQSFRSLTTAQYNALSSTEKNNGTYYHLTDSYSDVSFDSNVSQTPTTSDHDYRVLLSGSDNDTASVEGALKNADLIYNPYKHELRLYEDVSATAANYVQIYPDYINVLQSTSGGIDQMIVRSNDIWYNNTWEGTNNSLKSTISSINSTLSNLAADTGQQTVTSSYGDIKVRKIGKVVELFIWSDKAIPANQQIATLAAAYKPVVSVYPNRLYMRNAVSTSSNITLYVDNNGIIANTGNANTAGQWVVIHAMWTTYPLPS